jgi:hypothetical protein
VSRPAQYQACPICRLPAAEEFTGVHHADCIRCGKYTITSEAAALLDGLTLSDRQVANASGYIHDNQGLTIAAASLYFLKELRAPSVAERAIKLLKWLARENPGIGHQIDFSFLINRMQREQVSRASIDLHNAEFMRHAWGSVAASWSLNHVEVEFLLSTYLIHEAHFLDHDRRGSIFRVSITPKGWAHCDMMPLGASNVGFVAMWFAPEMDPVWENAFYPAIEDAGYTALRIDKKEHNNKIDDEIMASIRAAKFLVADFTGQRGGVYYESGFAQGLGKPVIWTIRHDDLMNVHFDTRQFNHIPWDAAHLGEFKLALQRRIEGSLGHGPENHE